MTSSFPLFTGTYSINARRYRKTPYQLKKLAENDKAASYQQEKFVDTPDYYEDEPDFGCMAPPGLPALKSKSKKQKVEKEESVTSTDPQPTEDERVQVIGGKKWIATISVPNCFIGKLIGMNRRALNALENETQCRMKTPRRDENKPCEITSLVSLESVQRCLDRVEIFLDDARKSARPTHFVAFPCDEPEIQDNFAVFKQVVMESEHFDNSCKNPLLFTKPARLHMTLSVARIFDDADIQKTQEAFKTLEQEIKEILGSEPLIADIQGIDMMNDDPSQVSVIYAKVGGAKIQTVANHIAHRLPELGVAAENRGEAVKLHVTLMNARYVAQADGKSKNFTFDATKVLEDLREMYFGTVQIKLCLCPLNSSTSAEKFYEKLVSFTLKGIMSKA